MNESLRHFIGKVCTISTLQINFRFKEQQMMDYFMGVIDAVDDQGILMTHTVTGSKNYIFLTHVVAIAEEQVLYEDNPEEAKIIEEFKKEKPATAEQRAVPNKFIDPIKMAELARKAKEKFSS